MPDLRPAHRKYFVLLFVLRGFSWIIYAVIAKYKAPKHKKRVTGKTKNGMDKIQTEPIKQRRFLGMTIGLVQGLVDMTPSGHIITNEKMQTNIPGVYAVGDIRDTVLRQVITAAADGAIAATVFANEI